MNQIAADIGYLAIYIVVSIVGVILSKWLIDAVHSYRVKRKLNVFSKDPDYEVSIAIVSYSIGAVLFLLIVALFVKVYLF